MLSLRMNFNYHLLAGEHLLGTVLLCALTMLLSLRIPEPGAEKAFRAALLMEALAGLAALPVFFSDNLGETRGFWVRVALALFAGASLTFFLFAARTITERWRSIKSRRPKL